jgi:DNA mismatch repair ATPase MutS
MSRRILQRTNSIEELTQQKEFITTVPKIISTMKKRMAKMFNIYDLVEKFSHPTNQDDFDQRWSNYGWTKKIYQQMDEAVAVQERSKKRFEKDLHVSQEAFVSVLKDYAKDVTALARFRELSKIEEIYSEVMRIDKSLKEGVAKVNLFHSRERLFGFPETPYEELNKVLRGNYFLSMVSDK